MISGPALRDKYLKASTSQNDLETMVQARGQWRETVSSAAWCPPAAGMHRAWGERVLTEECLRIKQGQQHDTPQASRANLNALSHKMWLMEDEGQLLAS